MINDKRYEKFKTVGQRNQTVLLATDILDGKAYRRLRRKKQKR